MAGNLELRMWRFDLRATKLTEGEDVLRAVPEYVRFMAGLKDGTADLEAYERWFDSFAHRAGMRHEYAVFADYVVSIDPKVKLLTYQLKENGLVRLEARERGFSKEFYDGLLALDKQGYRMRRLRHPSSVLV